MKKTSIAGTPLNPMEPEVEAKENWKQREYEAMRNDPALRHSIAERERNGTDLGKEENSLEEGDGKIHAGRKVRPENMPLGVKKSYIEINGKYYFTGRPDSLAFEDKGRQLRTKLNHGNVAGSMVDMAAAKGWTEIRVKGKDEFRREAWLHAASKGLAVRGYSPRDEDLARLKKLVRERPEDENEDRPDTGRHEDRGKEEAERPGPVDPLAPREKKEEQAAINARALLNEKEDLVQLAREYPDLVNDIAAIKIGGKLSRHISSDADRKWFMELVRERVAGNYLKGQGVPPIKIREERTTERPDREKEMGHER